MKKIIKGGEVTITYNPNTNKTINPNSKKKPLLNLNYPNGINPNNANKKVILELIGFMDIFNKKHLNLNNEQKLTNFKNLLSENLNLIDRLFFFTNVDGTNITFKNNNTDKVSCTLLMYACSINKVNFVNVLLEYGANACITNNKNKTASDYVTSNLSLKNKLKKNCSQKFIINNTFR
jgi:hypothetical protein